MKVTLIHDDGRQFNFRPEDEMVEIEQVTGRGAVSFKAYTEDARDIWKTLCGMGFYRW